MRRRAVVVIVGLAEQERVLRAAFADDPAARARLDAASADHRACLRLFVRGAGAWPRVARLPERSPSDTARCRVLPAVGGRTVVEWAVALADRPTGTSPAARALTER